MNACLTNSDKWNQERMSPSAVSPSSPRYDIRGGGADVGVCHQMCAGGGTGCRSSGYEVRPSACTYNWSPCLPRASSYRECRRVSDTLPSYLATQMNNEWRRREGACHKSHDGAKPQQRWVIRRRGMAKVARESKQQPMPGPLGEIDGRLGKARERRQRTVSERYSTNGKKIGKSE